MASSDLKSAALMEQMKTHLSSDAGKAVTKKIGLVYQINIAPKKLGFNEEIYVVDLKKGEVTKGAYEGGKPDATFSFTDEDFFKVATGKMNPQIAFMRGAMKVKGSLSAAQKFTPDIFPKPSKIVIDGDLYSSMSESEEEDVENSFFEGVESSSLVHDAQYFDDIIGEHVYKPDVPVQLIPFKALIFKSLKLAIKMYVEYAEIGGFDVRLSTQSMFDNKIIKKKHVICNRGGKQKKKSCDTLGTSGVRRKRNSNSRAIGCQAKIIFESVYGTPDYKVFQFDELHNHPLEKRSDLKKARQMSYSEKEFIVRASTSKIGPTMAHKISDDLFTNTDFRKRFSKLVWDINMKPDVFEVKWGLLMKEFNLEDTRWFKDMFTIRDSWIPGYFSDIPIHAFTIMMRYGVKEIPERYILKRWRKDVISRIYRFSSVQSDSGDCENVKLVNDSYYSFESCLDIVRDNKRRLALFAEKQQMLLKEFESDYISHGLKSKTDGEVVCKLLGVTIPIPEEINIHVPEVQSNKGSGIKKIIPSAGEVSYENSKKEHRMCSGCGKQVPHNLRTCLERVGAAKSAKDS
ncbi:unnamed protein product [Lactuca saligna]|uniref:Protein FAR1-RELATED SEQUENCE n=1 Tax=Lactuca saligna TaxID=75948 RepID=A0AA35Y4U5_LACSI|nr:unnamed protein product [Lactuca saligna]